MDYGHARNYWRAALVASAEGRFTAADFDEWFPGEPGHGELNDQVLEAFIRMLGACAQGRFGKPGQS